VYLSNEGVLMILLVGLISGWLAGKIVRGAGTGLIGDMAIGIVGAFIASWLLPRLGIGLRSGLIRAVINATIGAALFLTIIRLARA
jgi:uncharacterized membrane protein YeaQ/YmgE (transglycosylase-associated protein family)